jgi:hypothetical protein
MTTQRASLGAVWVHLWLDDRTPNCDLYAEGREGWLLDDTPFTNADLEEARAAPGEAVGREGHVLRYMDYVVRASEEHLSEEPDHA